MDTGKLFSTLQSYMRLPSGIQKEVARYFVKRILKKTPSDHQTIWTSFFYYISEHRVGISNEEEMYRVQFDSGSKPLQTFIRRDSSDIFVFFQVFIADGYQPLIDFIHKNSIKPATIIDAGANVGYFSLLALNHFSPGVLLALEPEKSNFDQLKKSIDLNNFSTACKLTNAALWTHETRLSLQASAGKEWAVKVTAADTNSGCEALSLNAIMKRENLTTVDILKIDIEGTEDVLFKNPDFLDRLSQVKVIAMEIHDDQADRKLIHQELSRRYFKFFEQGELTVAWNTKYVHAQ